MTAAWLSLLAVPAAALAFFAGRRLGRRRRARRAAPLAFAGAAAFFLWRRFCPWRSLGPLSFLYAGKNEYLLLALAAAFAIGWRAARLERRRERLVLAVLGPGLVGLALLPFGLRWWTNLAWPGRETVYAGAVCLQQSPYSCGPASLVTVMRWRGFPVSEAQAVLTSWTVPLLGTEPDMIVAAIGELSGGRLAGRCRARAPAELPELEFPALTIVDWRGPLGHYVALLEADESSVTIGDPLGGRRRLTRTEFAAVYRGYVIEIGS